MKAYVMLAAVATSALLLIPTVAPAQTVSTVQISHAGIDLSVPANRAKIDARIARAIEQVCAEPGMRGIGRIAMERACADSVSSNVAAVHLALIGRAHGPRG